MYDLKTIEKGYTQLRNFCAGTSQRMNREAMRAVLELLEQQLTEATVPEVTGRGAQSVSAADAQETDRRIVGERLYLVYESNHGDFDGDSVELTGIFCTLEAVEAADSSVDLWRNDDEVVIDSEFDGFDTNELFHNLDFMSCRVFKGYQDNWQAYFDVRIEALTVA